MARFTDGRRTLELGRAVRNLLGCEAQIMRTGLGRDGHAAGLCLRKLVNRFSRRHVHDMHARSELSCETDHHADGFHFRSWWTRCKIRRIVADPRVRPGADAWVGNETIDHVW